MKQIILVHGWEGNPENCWFPWLKKELEFRGYKVNIPAMPNTEKPKIEVWVPYLKKVVGEVDEDTYFVGHSIGCQTIMRYLQELPRGSKIGGVVFVAGWVSLTPIAIRTKEDQKIVKPWFETPINFDKIKLLSNKFVAIFSDNDPYVPIKENSNTYKEKLGAKIIIERGRGHFSDDAGVKELPVVLNEILKMAK